MNKIVTQRESARTSECLNNKAPEAAPANMAATDPIRRCQRGLLPPANEESAAKPESVNVKTVMVRSGTASLRTVAFLTPIASAVRTIKA